MKSTKIFDSAREIVGLFKRLVETQERQTKLLEEQTVYSKAQYLFAAKRFEPLLELEKIALLNHKVTSLRTLNGLVYDSVNSLFLRVLPEAYDTLVRDIEKSACEVLHTEPNSIKFGCYADMRRIALLADMKHKEEERQKAPKQVEEPEEPEEPTEE